MGELYPGYEVRQSLQEVGSHQLHRALRLIDGQPVLLKVLRPSPSLSQDAARLEKELFLAHTLESSAILRPLALERWQGTLALVLEDFAGRPLRQLLERPLEPRRFLRLAGAMAGALAELHQLGYIHKDLRPDNFLVDEESGLVKLTGLGFASRLPGERVPAKTPTLLEGTLPYISPEQTGRMNRTTDRRADLYSLGVTYYEMLSGRLPFEARDPLEWVHCHIARRAPSLATVSPGVPALLSEIVMKLLAKVVEERYQSAAGVRYDLERALSQLDQPGWLERFPLGEADAGDRFQVQHKLYGRDEELARLLGCFERVTAKGAPELALIAGTAGIGKSALASELQKEVTGARGSYISGKFDKQQQNTPYAVLLQAFSEIVLELLSEPEESLSVWRRELQQALGKNGQVIVDLIPQVEIIVGPQQPLPELPPAETQNRLLLVFQAFVGAISCRREHPVALFLDDMQWADADSLRLICGLLRSTKPRYLLVIGAYRDK